MRDGEATLKRIGLELRSHIDALVLVAGTWCIRDAATDIDEWRNRALVSLPPYRMPPGQPRKPSKRAVPPPATNIHPPQRMGNTCVNKRTLVLRRSLLLLARTGLEYSKLRAALTCIKT